MKDLTIRPFVNIIDQQSYKELTDQVREICIEHFGSFKVFSFLTVMLEKLTNEETSGDVHIIRHCVIITLASLVQDREVISVSDNPFSDIYWNTVKNVDKKYYPLIFWLQHQYIISCIEDYNSNVEKFINNHS
jgi:hypothetical protein